MPKHPCLYEADGSTASLSTLPGLRPITNTKDGGNAWVRELDDVNFAFLAI